MIQPPTPSAVGAALDAGIKSALTPFGSGNILPVDRSKTPAPPPLASGKTGEYVFSGPGIATMPKGYDFVVVSATSANLTGNADANQRILAGSAHLTFNAVAGGSGSVIAGNGNNLITIPVTDSGSWMIALGGGNDTVRALGGGNNTVSAGVGTGGTSQISLGGGKSAVSVGGSSTISGSKTGGAETITATGTTVVNANASNLLFLGAAGSGATVFGGTGSATIQGGGGAEWLQGGSAGNNSIQGGTGAATLIGGGDGDRLFAGMGVGALQVLKAGSGNETLVGTAGSGFGQDTFYGSTGLTTVLSGGGVNHYVPGQGLGVMEIHIDSLAGGYQSSANQFDFFFGKGGGSIVEMGFTSVSQIHFHLDAGFGANDVTSLTQNAVSGSDLNVTLNDGTKVTFLNIASTLTNSNFV